LKYGCPCTSTAGGAEVVIGGPGVATALLVLPSADAAMLVSVAVASVVASFLTFSIDMIQLTLMKNVGSDTFGSVTADAAASDTSLTTQKNTFSTLYFLDFVSSADKYT
jgi:hypothetical protein